MPAEVQLLSVIIPVKDEEGCVTKTLEALLETLRKAEAPFEILTVDDRSTDGTRALLTEFTSKNHEVRYLQNRTEPGFGNAIKTGLSKMKGDAAVIFMADQSDNPNEVVTYRKKLNEGYDCVFGSRFIKGGRVMGYPLPKLILNRLANKFIQFIFGIRLNDTTNAFKAYRKEVVEGCRPLLSPHFNLTVELPLKAIIRGYTWTVVPISWQNRKSGTAKFRIREMGSRYVFIILYAWLEKYFSRGDYHRSKRDKKG